MKHYIVQKELLNFKWLWNSFVFYVAKFYVVAHMQFEYIFIFGRDIIRMFYTIPYRSYIDLHQQLWHHSVKSISLHPIWRAVYCIY